jgi:YVTN family beta-propeller protein
LTVNPDGTRLYAVSDADTVTANAVTVIDTETNAVIATIAAGVWPEHVAFSRDGTRAYVTNYGDGTVSVIDAATDSVTDTFSVGGYPAGVAVAPDGAKVYVTNGKWQNQGANAGWVKVINATDHTVAATIPVGTAPAQWPSAPTAPSPT